MVIGTESNVDIPLNKWTHVVLAFCNYSTSVEDASTNPDYQYSVALYINGRLDVSIKYSSLVVGNDGAAHFFKDISHSGEDLLLLLIALVSLFSDITVCRSS